MSDAPIQIALAEQVRTRWVECLQSFRSAKSSYSGAEYDRVFWQNPEDWPEFRSENKQSVANILFKPENHLKGALDQEADYPFVFAEYLDGVYNVCLKPCADFDWKCFDDADFSPFHKRQFDKLRPKFTDQRDHEAVWTVIGGDGDEEFCPNVAARIHRLNRVTPEALQGVAIHVDLTFDSLELQIVEANNVRRISLPQWGVLNYLSRVHPQLTAQRNRSSLYSLLKNSATYITDAEGNFADDIEPRELMMSVYVNRLQHLIPFMPESNLRLTGWFCCELLQQEVEKQITPRVRAIHFGYPYQTINYER